MNYIYDILLNFTRTIYDFFEWNKDDEILHIKKIPYFKITSNQLYTLKYSNIIVDKTFLNKIRNKAELFNNKNFKYLSLFSDGKDVIAVMFNKNGFNYKKSVLTIDEQNDIINIINTKKILHLNYKLITKKSNNQFKTRFEIENKKYVEKEMLKIYEKKDYKKLGYICLECLGKNEKNIHKAFLLLKKEITKRSDNFYKIFDLLKMINQR